MKIRHVTLQQMYDEWMCSPKHESSHTGITFESIARKYKIKSKTIQWYFSFKITEQDQPSIIKIIRTWK